VLLKIKQRRPTKVRKWNAKVIYHYFIKVTFPNTAHLQLRERTHKQLTISEFW